MKNITLPLKITEHPHRGAARDYIIYDDNHLAEIIDSLSHTSYDGDGSLNSYIDWLRRDLSRLEVEPA